MDEASDRGPGQGERRTNHRFEIATDALLRREGSAVYRVRVFDLSQSGCKVELVERADVGDAFWLKFEGLESLHATVSWLAHPAAVLKFDRPIHPAVFDMLMAKLAEGGPTS